VAAVDAGVTPDPSPPPRYNPTHMARVNV
jgi:hypothetical protein